MHPLLIPAACIHRDPAKLTFGFGPAAIMLTVAAPGACTNACAPCAATASATAIAPSFMLFRSAGCESEQRRAVSSSARPVGSSARMSNLRCAFERVDERRGLRVRVRSDVVKKCSSWTLLQISERRSDGRRTTTPGRVRVSFCAIESSPI